MTIDARPVKDFNRETCKELLVFQWRFAKGSLSDFVDEPNVEECMEKVKCKVPMGTHIIVLLDDMETNTRNYFLKRFRRNIAEV